jgi:nucleoside-diphosphate-sugar epimerase
MATTRRTFLKQTTAAGLGALTIGVRPAKAKHPLRILILGGTSFIGPFQVQYALDRGHTVTLFNRGRTNTHLFPDVERLLGDRNGDYESLKGRTWDVVLDNSASNPDWVRMSTAALKGSVERYFYVSSRSAYADTSAVPMHAGHPTFTFESAEVAEGTPTTDLPYGLRKAMSERQAMEAFPDNHVILRPGLIIGPRDQTDRFTYWPVRIHRGGEVLAPGSPNHTIQIIDARDFSEWMVRLAENGNTGVFNAVGPAEPRPLAELLYGIRAVTTAETRFTWVDTDFLLSNGARPYSDLPVWMPPLPGREGFAKFDLTPEIAAGLTFRPLAVTVRDTLDYHFARTAERQADLRAGMPAEREAELLKMWHARG